MSEHELKCWPSFFDAIQRGDKTFEVRYDDRGFQAGDTVTLKEWDPQQRELIGYGAFTGRALTARIGYVLHAIPATQHWPPQVGHNLDGYVVFSLLDVQDDAPIENGEEEG
jgi:hypothetical protein